MFWATCQGSWRVSVSALTEGTRLFTSSARGNLPLLRPVIRPWDRSVTDAQGATVPVTTTFQPSEPAFFTFSNGLFANGKSVLARHADGCWIAENSDGLATRPTRRSRRWPCRTIRPTWRRRERWRFQFDKKSWVLGGSDSQVFAASPLSIFLIEIIPCSRVSCTRDIRIGLLTPRR
jgi:hypothetical protein